MALSFLDINGANRLKDKIIETQEKILDVYINENNHLILVFSNGKKIDAGLLEVGSNYEMLENKPSINGVQLIGDTSIDDIGVHNHYNFELLNDLTTDGVDLYFKNVNVTNIVLEEGRRNYSAVILNAISNNIYQIGISSSYKECDLVVQSWKFVDGDADLITIAKVFNNSYRDNFLVTGNVDFDQSCCKIRDSYEYATSVDENEFYISEEIDLDTFSEFNNIKLEVV